MLEPCHHAILCRSSLTLTKLPIALEASRPTGQLKLLCCLKDQHHCSDHSVICCMGCCCSSAKVLMDATFTVAGSPEAVNAKLRTPEAWLAIIPGSTNGMIKDKTDTSFTAVTPYPIIIHSIAPFTTIDAGLQYSVSLQALETPEATFDVSWSFKAAASGTEVRRHITNFRAHKKLCLPWTLVLRIKCAQENANLQALFA